MATDHVEKISFKNGKKITCFQGLFIKQAIDKAVDKKYNYGYKFSQGRIRKQIILLPITSEGKPDYEFMEEYIKEIINKKRQKYIEYVKDKIKSLKVVGGGQSLENTNWIEFKISDVFLLKASNSGIDKNKLIDGSEKNIPYITRSNLSNGIFSFVYKKQGLKYKLDEGNQISIGLDTQTVFYQPYKFYTGQNIQQKGGSQFHFILGQEF